MEKIKIGLQVHAVREDFNENPAETIKRIAQIGYQGVECTYDHLKDKGATYYKKLFEENNLECYSIMFNWKDVLNNKLDEIIDLSKQLNCEVIVLGGLDFSIETYNDSNKFSSVGFIEKVKEIADKIRLEGFKTGFHNHDFDHLTNIDGNKIEDEGGLSIFDYIMQNTGNDYMMMVDTGNAQGGKADPIDMINKYPHRTEYAHFKGYSQAKDYLTPVWEAEIDSDKLINTLVEKGDAKVFSIEFGKRGDYVPFERAERSYQWLSQKLREKGLY